VQTQLVIARRCDLVIEREIQIAKGRSEVLVTMMKRC